MSTKAIKNIYSILTQLNKICCLWYYVVVPLDYFSYSHPLAPLPPPPLCRLRSKSGKSVKEKSIQYLSDSKFCRLNLGHFMVFDKIIFTEVGDTPYAVQSYLIKFADKKQIKICKLIFKRGWNIVFVHWICKLQIVAMSADK